MQLDYETSNHSSWCRVILWRDGRAEINRPLHMHPSNIFTALCMASSCCICANPKPRHRPVSGNFDNLQSWGRWPVLEKTNANRSGSVIFRSSSRKKTVLRANLSWGKLVGNILHRGGVDPHSRLCGNGVQACGDEFLAGWKNDCPILNQRFTSGT